MLRLEGHVHGKRISRDFEAAELVAVLVCSLLEEIDPRRLTLILGSLLSAAGDGKSWGWSAEEFTLTLHGKAEQ